MVNKTSTKTCFIVAPIGEPDSNARKRSDQLYKHIVEPIIKARGYKPVRADMLAQPGLITHQVLQHLVQDDLVVADLSGHNPNVFYELAIRHATRKHVIQMISVGERIPFDVTGLRTIYYNLADPDSVEACREELDKQTLACEAEGEGPTTPVSLTIDALSIQGSTHPLETVSAEIIGKLAEVSERITGVESTLSSVVKNSADSSEGSSARYIDGQEEAFEALTAVTKRAKSIVRSTRFFPDSVLSQPQYVSAMEHRVLGTDGGPPLQHYYRIIAINNPEKQRDVNHHLNMFHGTSFELYLTRNQNTFELVIVDETDAFIHFYKEERVVASTLHIRGKPVTREFIDIFDKLTRRDLIKHIDCRLIHPDGLIDYLAEVDQIFKREFPVEERAKRQRTGVQHPKTDQEKSASQEMPVSMP